MYVCQWYFMRSWYLKDREFDIKETVGMHENQMIMVNFGCLIAS